SKQRLCLIEYTNMVKVDGNRMDQTIHLDIKGMHCAACATRIEKAVSKIDGVTSIYVNLTTEKGQVTFNEHLTSIFDITHKISKIGFEAANTFDNNIQSSH